MRSAPLGEVHMNARIPDEPALDLGMFVRDVVVAGMVLRYPTYLVGAFIYVVMPTAAGKLLDIRARALKRVPAIVSQLETAPRRCS